MHRDKSPEFLSNLHQLHLVPLQHLVKFIHITTNYQRYQRHIGENQKKYQFQGRHNNHRGQQHKIVVQNHNDSIQNHVQFVGLAGGYSRVINKSYNAIGENASDQHERAQQTINQNDKLHNDHCECTKSLACHIMFPGWFWVVGVELINVLQNYGQRL